VLFIQVVCMEDYNFSDLDKESLLIVVTSTFGNGDCPGNGEVWIYLCTVTCCILIIIKKNIITKK